MVEDAQRIGDDAHIRAWLQSHLHWSPPIMSEFDYGRDLVYTLRGPRQIGKTTAIKIRIRSMLESNVHPWNIMYHALDVGYDPSGLVDLVYEYQDNMGGLKPGSRRYLFLDEISSVANWQKAIKYLWDQGSLKGCTVIATGSHTADLRRSSEPLPGRRGDTDGVLDKFMSPMSFAEYACLTDAGALRLDEKMGGAGGRRRVLEELLAGRAPAELSHLWVGTGGLNRCLDDYMISGGVPKIADAYWHGKSVTKKTMSDYLATLTREFGHLEMDDDITVRLVRALIKTVGWPTAWGSLRKNSDIGSDESVVRYVKNLSGMMCLSVVYQYDHASKAALYKKSKKIFFRDPFFYHVLNMWANHPDYDGWRAGLLEDSHSRGVAVEGIVASHLLKMAFMRGRNKLWHYSSQFLYCWRYGKDREVDFVYNDRRGVELPIEVKFQEKITKRDLDGLINFKKRTGAATGAILTKDKFAAKEECIMIPAAAFLFLV